MIRAKLLLMGYFLLTAMVHADLTDFKVIDAAHKAYDAKEYTKSVGLYNSLEKKSAQKSYDVGNAYYKSKNYDAAIKSYKEAKGVNKAMRLHNIGNAYFQKKDLDMAIKSYEESLKIQEDEETRFNLELTKKMKKQQEKQKKDQEKKKDQDKKDNKDQKKDDQKKDDQKKKNQQKKDKKNDQKKKDKQKKDKEGKNKKENDKKEGDKKKSDSNKEKKPKDKKGDKSSNIPKEQKKISKEEKLKHKELRRLLKQMKQKGTPTMMYRMGNDKKEKRSGGANPW